MPSVLWRCWLGGRKGIRPVKTEWWGAGVVICLERGADLHAQLMPLPLTVSCFSKIQTGFAFLVPAYLGSPGKRAVKWVCVCVFQWKDFENQLRFDMIMALTLVCSFLAHPVYSLGSVDNSEVNTVCKHICQLTSYNSILHRPKQNNYNKIKSHAYCSIYLYK